MDRRKERVLLPGLWLAGLTAIFSFFGLLALLFKFTGIPQGHYRPR